MLKLLSFSIQNQSLQSRGFKPSRTLPPTTGACLASAIIAILLAGAIPSGSASIGAVHGHRPVVSLNGFGYTSGIVIQADGRIVVAGSDFNDFILRRYNKDETPDQAFGSAGLVKVHFRGYSSALAVAIQSDGKIVAVGWLQIGIIPFASISIVAVRCNYDGSLDAAFGDGGRVILNPGGADSANSVAIQPDGKIVIGGIDIMAPDIVDYGNRFTLARLNPDGSLDAAFGNGGSVITRFYGSNDELSDIALQTDGKIIATGFTFTGKIHYFELQRYDSDGSLDPTFGTGGVAVTTSTREDAFSDSIALQPNGGIIVSGVVGGKVALARYQSDGSLDAEFGEAGIVLSMNGDGRSVALQTDGKIVVGGSFFNGVDNDFAILRFNSDGSADTGFGAGGVITANLGFTEEGTALAIEPHGRIVMAGDVQKGDPRAPKYKMALVEFLP